MCESAERGAIPVLWQGVLVKGVFSGLSYRGSVKSRGPKYKSRAFESCMWFHYRKGGSRRGGHFIG